MSHTQNVTPSVRIPVYQRFTDIDEDIHQILSLHALSLYIAFRFQAQFGQDSSRIKRTARETYERAKISRAQYYRCINELEHVGLIKRDINSKLGEASAIYIARHLYHFTPELAPKPQLISEGVSASDRGVSASDTLISNSFNKDLTNSNSQEIDRSKPKLAKKSGDPVLREMIDAYRETFPDNPQPHKTLISTNLEKLLRSFIKRWPEHDPKGEAMTIEGFRRYLLALKQLAPKFSLGLYRTADGREKKNDLQTFCRWNTIVSFLEEKYS